MPTSLTVDRHREVLLSAGRRLAELVASVPDTTPVPTCPGWDVRTLLAHQAMVHRWATARIVGATSDDSTDDEVSEERLLAEVDDLPGFYREGLDSLVAALEAAPEGLEALVFLNDAPPPRQFWARRQAHETTVHAVDALAATLGRIPTAGEAGVELDLAVDGIDELVCGFFTRGRSKLFDGEAFSVAVSPSDADRHWTLAVDERMTARAADGPGPCVDDVAPVVVSGSSAGIYLGLWNRGDDLEVAGRPELLARWRATQRVRWS